MKDAGLRIRVKRDHREKFLELCRRKDRPAVQVVREFMRRYIAEHDRKMICIQARIELQGLISGQ